MTPNGNRYPRRLFQSKFPKASGRTATSPKSTEQRRFPHSRPFSDAVLNPGGVRIGTAEIYRVVEAMHEVVEALAIGQEWEDDTRVVLFVVLREGESLTSNLRATIRKNVRQQASPRHMPAVIAQVPDVPRTLSGKIAELAARETVHGREITNISALGQPGVLAAFRDHPSLQP